jgi:haloalkane dehalogenase
MLHGLPTWSYLYRRFIGPLGDAGYRTIAYDQLGFGRSDKPWRQSEYSLARHIAHLTALVDGLGLEHVTLVVHDWGGPIGLGWAVDHPERVQRLVLFNTFAAYLPEGTPMHPVYRAARAPLLGQVLMRGRNLFTERGLFRLSNLTEEERRAYRAPHPGWRWRGAVAKAPRMIPWDSGNPSKPIGEHIWAELDRLAGKPTLICWGMKDPILGPPALRFLHERFGAAEVQELAGARHFVQEDAPEEILPLLLDFLRRSR